MKGLKKTENSSEKLVDGILHLWLKTSYPHLTRPRAEAKFLANSFVREFTSWVSGLDILTGAFWLGSAYASLAGNETRKKHSLYFTPPYLASRILDNAGKTLLWGKIIDPACGGAAFLAPAAERVAKELVKRGHTSEQVLDYLEANLYGCDSDAFLCKLSATFLRMILAEHIASAGREPSFKIQPGDGLTTFKTQAGTFSLVLCNPPYKKLTKDEAAPHQKTYADVIKGQPNLYALFMRRSMRLLAPKGKAVLLTPMSFLSGQYFSKLRQLLADEGHVNQLDLIHEKAGVFLGAEQDSAITVWNRTNGAASSTTIYALSAGGGCSYIGKLLLSKADTPWPVPRNLADNDLLPLLQRPKHSLTSYGYKPRIGAIVVHRDRRIRYSRIGPSSKANHPVPIIWASDVGTDGVLRLNGHGRNEFNFVDMASSTSPSITKQPAIAMQRVTSHEQNRRLICDWEQLDVIFVHWSGHWEAAFPGQYHWSDRDNKVVKRRSICVCGARQFRLNRRSAGIVDWFFECAFCNKPLSPKWLQNDRDTLRIIGPAMSPERLTEVRMQATPYRASSAYYVKSDLFIDFKEGSQQFLTYLRPGREEQLKDFVAKQYGFATEAVTSEDVQKACEGKAECAKDLADYLASIRQIEAAEQQLPNMQRWCLATEIWHTLAHRT